MKIFFISVFFLVSTSTNSLLKNNQLVSGKAQSFIINHPLEEKGLFESDEVLNIILQGNITELLNDRSDDMSLHPVQLSYPGADKNNFFLQVEMKTRGHFRRLKENCMYPPLSIQFHKNDTLANSIFREQEKLKLVMPCSTDEYVIREWLVYKLYNLVTPKSFRARLVKIQLDDLKNKKEFSPFYGILLEEENQMARRNRLSSVEVKIIPEQAEPETFLDMAVFQYLIGNTDWSVQFMQNIKLLALDSRPLVYTVPYDFDHAGIVNAPYAKPAEQLNMSSVTERRYRGYCLKDMKAFDSVFVHYQSLKQNIYDLYANCPLIDEKYKKRVLKYLDDFYKTIDDKKMCQREFTYPCNKNGTGNVVIKGMKEQ
jgi:hypothetical protein